MTIKAILERSPLQHKKWRVIFYRKPDIEEHIDFGSSSYEDYTQHHDDHRKRLFKSRFKILINHYKNDPSSAMTLSNMILWEDKDINVAFKKYKKYFGFK
jgi:hypothetical protein